MSYCCVDAELERISRRQILMLSTTASLCSLIRSSTLRTSSALKSRMSRRYSFCFRYSMTQSTLDANEIAITGVCVMNPKIGTVQTARNQIIGVSKHRNEFSPGLNSGEIDLPLQTFSRFTVQVLHNVRNDAFVVPTRRTGNHYEVASCAKGSQNLCHFPDVAIMKRTVGSRPIDRLGKSHWTQCNDRPASRHCPNGSSTCRKLEIRQTQGHIRYYRIICRAVE